MKQYLSHGGGVNSTALMLLLEQEGVEFESVFADTGVEFPETYQYLDYLRSMGFRITRITPCVGECKTLEEYCLKYQIIPAITRRFCTGKFKIKPLVSYYEKPCIEYIGYSADESRRALRSSSIIRWKKGIKVEYPLIERRISRQGCIEIIKEARLQVPRKSGCWLCPFMSRKKVRKLYTEYPELYERRRQIEKINPRGFTFDRKGVPMSAIVAEGNQRLDDFLGGNRRRELPQAGGVL